MKETSSLVSTPGASTYNQKLFHFREFLQGRENELCQPKTLRFFTILYLLLLVDGLNTDFKAVYQTCPEIK